LYGATVLPQFCPVCRAWIDPGIELVMVLVLLEYGAEVAADPRAVGPIDVDGVGIVPDG
jgi:hypothetical protein